MDDEYNTNLPHRTPTEPAKWEFLLGWIGIAAVVFCVAAIGWFLI